MRERKACPAFIQTTKRFSFGTAHALQGAERTLRGSAMTPRELSVRSGSGRSLGQWRCALSVSGRNRNSTEISTCPPRAMWGCVSQTCRQGLVHLLGFFCCERSLRCKVLETVSSGDKNPEICARLPRLIEECACSGRVDVRHSEAAPRAPLLPHRWLLCAAVFKTTLCARTTPLRQTAQAALWGLSSARRHGRPHGSVLLTAVRPERRV